MDSANGHPFAASLYALRSSQLRIQLKARNKSVRQQARLTKNQNTSLGLQSRPFGGCELLQNVYLCSSKHNFFLFFVSAKLVVNCFKMCIFAVASTIYTLYTYAS